MRRALAVGLLLVVAAAGCRKQQPPRAAPQPLPSVAQTGKPHPVVADPRSRERLQELVMIQQEGGGDFRTHETHSKPLDAGALHLSLRGLATSHTLTARSLQMTSEEYYVRVGVLLVNTGTSPQPVDLRFALLKSAKAGEVGISRAAQQAEPRPLQLQLQPGDKVERTLYFETTQAVLEPGLSLALPASAFGSAESKMELL